MSAEARVEEQNVGRVLWEQFRPPCFVDEGTETQNFGALLQDTPLVGDRGSILTPCLLTFKSSMQSPVPLSTFLHTSMEEISMDSGDLFPCDSSRLLMRNKYGPPLA